MLILFVAILLNNHIRVKFVVMKRSVVFQIEWITCYVYVFNQIVVLDRLTLA